MPIFAPQKSSSEMSNDMTGFAPSKQRRTSGLALKCAASALAITTLLAANPASAQYATGGEGKYRSQILWFSWGSKGTEVPNAGLTKTNTYDVAGQQLVVTCSISGITGTRSTGNHFDVYASGDWKGDGLDDLYNSGATGKSNTLATGLRNAFNGARAEGTIGCSATYAGLPYALEGLVFADAEATAKGSIDVNTGVLTGEGLGITLSNESKFRFIEQFSRNCNTTEGETGAVRYVVSATASGSTETQYTFTTPDGNCETDGTGPMGIGFIDGSTQGKFWVKGNGSQAIALGVMTYIADLGDAPRSFGQPAHVPQFTWEGGEVPLGTSANIFSSSFELAKPVQPLIRLGATVDVETIDQYGPRADGDNLSGASDDDALPGNVVTPLLAPNDVFTLENVLCSAETSAPVYGYIDWNRDGDFLDAGERSSLATCVGIDSSVNLKWTTPGNLTGGDSYLRLRTAAIESQIATPDGVAMQGEVEDYEIFITTSRIQLTKELRGRVLPDDQFNVEIVQAGEVLASKATTGNGGGTNATATTDIVAAASGSDVILREAISAGGSLAGYERTMSCVAGPENKIAFANPVYDTVSGTWSLPVAQGNDIRCTLTNTGKPYLAVTKTTEGGFGDAFSFTSTNLNGVIANITTTAHGVASPAVPTFQTPISFSTPVVFSELPVAGYQLTSAACVDVHADGTGNAATVSSLVSGQLIVDPAALRPGARIVCNFINGKDAVIQLTKELPRGRFIATDQFGLAIKQSDAALATTVTSGSGATIANGNVSVPATQLGQEYVLEETAAGTPLADLARYQVSWNCTNSSIVPGAQTPSGTGTSLTVIPAAGDNLVCTVSNDRASLADMSITKTNTIANGLSDQADDVLLPGRDTTYVLTITNNGPDSMTGAVVNDPAPAEPLTCPATAPVTCTGSGCPTGALTLGQLQIAPGLTLGTLANGETLTLSYTCRVN